MPDLYPMQPHGEAQDSKEPLLVAERDPIALEDPAASLTDFKQWNEARAYTRRLIAHRLEHSKWGLHLTLRVPQVFINYGYSAATGEHFVSPDCYIQDPAGQFVKRGLDVFTGGLAGINRLAAGRTEFQLDFDLAAPAADKVGMTEFEANATEYDLNGDNYTRRGLYLESVGGAGLRTIVVRRFRFGAPVPVGVDEDGFYCFALHTIP